MSKLAALREKYQIDTPDLNEPDPNCRKCGGAGEYPSPVRDGEMTFCMCLFIAEQSDRDWIGPMLAKAAKEALEDIQRRL